MYTLNQYASVNGVSYSYDADGNLVSDGVRNLGWDIRNRLIQVTKEGKTIAYNYDHNDLRVEKEVDGRKIKYYYDGSLLLCEKDGAGKMQKVYINDGEGIVGMIRYIYKNIGEFSHHQRLYYMYDSLGSISVVTGENGLPIQNYTYSPYGSTMNIDYDPVNNLRFVGRYGGYCDDDTGLINFWSRWYDTISGRWLSYEPSGCFVGNLYTYVYNNPSNKIDRTGFYQEDPFTPGTPPTKIDAYGNWCGKNRSGGWQNISNKGGYNYSSLYAPTVDELDECCKKHDICLYLVDVKKVLGKYDKCGSDYNADKRKCNRDLIDCASQAKTKNELFKELLVKVFKFQLTAIIFTPGGGWW